MDPMMTWVALGGGFLAGFACGWVVGRDRTDRSWMLALSPRRGDLKRDATKLSRQRHA